MSSQRDRILGDLSPGNKGIAGETITLFEEKTRDYGDNAFELGVKGQFSDIWRKIGKLRKALWDGESLVGEQPEEILMDLIGHCWLTIDLIRQGEDSEGGKVELDVVDVDVLKGIAAMFDLDSNARRVLNKIIEATR